jgi:D-amino-acid dehydrogenase
MKACVIGGGVVGVATAYFLAKDGHEVTMLEARENVALETSFSNGGQLSYSYVAPLADPSVLPHLPAWLIQKDSALRFVPRIDLKQWLWCLSFLWACRASVSRQTALELLQLGALSRAAVHDLIAKESIAFDYKRNGKLVLYRNQHAFDQACSMMSYLGSAGASQQALDPNECVALEPALAHARPLLVGGIYTPSEEVGDCFLFTQALARVLREHYGVNILCNTSVKSWHWKGEKIVAAYTTGGDIMADAYVVTSGLGSCALLSSLGISLPLYPLTGYSLTMTATAAQTPRVSVTDLHRKVVYAPLGERIRIAGMVEISGADESRSKTRLACLIRHAREIFPQTGDYEHAQTWVGHRPATPHSKPIISATSYSNLWINTGHGALGFTFACGSAQLIAQAMQGSPTALDLRPYQIA